MFITINHPLSIWGQLGSLSFFLAGNFSDLLIIRLCLSSAYVCAFANSVLGSPLWPAWHNPNRLQLDALCWAILNLYVHLSTVVRLLWDERPVQLKQEPLWRLFYRTGGLSQKLFQQTIDPYCEAVTFLKGQDIPMDDLVTQQRQWFYIVYKGQVQLKVVGSTADHGNTIVSSTTRIAESGQHFDFRDLGFLKDSAITTGNAKHRHKLSSAKALSEQVVLFRFPAKLMATQIANHPTTRLMWKELLMENLLRIVQRHFYKARRGRVESSAPIGRPLPVQQHQHNGHNKNNLPSPVVGDYDDEINPVFWPLEEWEKPNPLRAGSGLAMHQPIRHIIASMKLSFTPPWPVKGFPTGLRHQQHLQAPPASSPTGSKKEPEMSPWKHHELDDGEEVFFDAESHSLIDAGIRTSVRSVRYSSVAENFVQEGNFLQYLNEMDEDTGLGLNISFLEC